MLLLILYNHLYYLFFSMPGGEAPQQFTRAAKRRSNLRGRASKNNAFCFSRRRCDCLQHSRKNKQKRYILSFAKSCPFVRHKFHRTNSEKKKIQVLLSGGEAPQQFTRASRHKRQIVFFAKPCPFVRHKFHRTNSEEKIKFKFFCPAAKRRSNLRGRAGIKDKLYFSRSLARLCGINSTAQTQRKKENSSSFVPLFSERKAGAVEGAQLSSPSAEGERPYSF